MIRKCPHCLQKAENIFSFSPAGKPFKCRNCQKLVTYSMKKHLLLAVPYFVLCLGVLPYIEISSSTKVIVVVVLSVLYAICYPRMVVLYKAD